MENKPVLVFIHGYAVGSWYYDDFKNYFEKLGYRCYAANLPFHDVHPNKKHDEVGKLSLKDYIDHLEKEILAIGEKCILVGHSLGGLLAQHLANRGLADDLVLLQPAAPKDISMIVPRYAHHHAGPLTAALSKKPFKYSFKSAKALFFNGLSEQAAVDLYHKTVFESGQVMYDIITHQQPEIRTENIKGKVLCIAGSQDKGCTPKIVHKISKKYGEKSTYKEFVNRGHEIVIEDNWEEVADYIDHWLKANILDNTHSASNLQAA